MAFAVKNEQCRKNWSVVLIAKKCLENDSIEEKQQCLFLNEHFYKWTI